MIRYIGRGAGFAVMLIFCLPGEPIAAQEADESSDDQVIGDLVEERQEEDQKGLDVTR